MAPACLLSPIAGLGRRPLRYGGACNTNEAGESRILRGYSRKSLTNSPRHFYHHVSCPYRNRICESMSLFLLKKIVTPLFYPLSVVLFALCAGLFLLWRNKRRREGLLLVTIAVIVLACASFDFFADGLIRSLEHWYPPLMVSEKNRPQNIQWIVVLGGGHTVDPALPVSSQISGDSLVRLFEGVRLHRKLPGSKLILSGGAVFQKKAEAETMASVAEVMGVSSMDIIQEGQSRDTEDQVRLLKPLIGSKPFILVTSAVHMPRSMDAFKRKGLLPIAAPTGHVTTAGHGFQPRRFYPAAETLRYTEMAVHEYLGIFWMNIRSRVSGNM